MTQNSDSATSLAPGWWARARAWMDSDGYHVWLAHDCTTKRIITMLPWSTWHAVGGELRPGDRGRAEPSIVCTTCDLHVFVDVYPLEPHEPDAIAWAAG